MSVIHSNEFVGKLLALTPRSLAFCIKIESVMHAYGVLKHRHRFNAGHNELILVKVIKHMKIAEPEEDLSAKFKRNNWLMRNAGQKGT